MEFIIILLFLICFYLCYEYLDLLLESDGLLKSYDSCIQLSDDLIDDYNKLLEYYKELIIENDKLRNELYDERDFHAIHNEEHFSFLKSKGLKEEFFEYINKEVDNG